MFTSSFKQPSKLALLFVCLGMTATIISGASVLWQAPNSASQPLILNAGSYALPLTILADSMFPWPIKLVSNDTRFQFQAGFYITYQATYANDILGCAGSVPAGLYTINYTLDNASWSGPGLLYVQVSTIPIDLYIDPVLTILSGSITGPTFNLVSLSPWSDMTVTATVSSNEFSVSPSAITFRPNSTQQGFTYSTNSNTKSTSSATVTFTVSGTNAATFNVTQATGLVRVPGGSNASTTTTPTTTTPTTTTPTTTTNTSTTTPTTTTPTTTTPTTTTPTTTTPTTTTNTSTTTPTTTTPTTTTPTTTTPTTTTPTTTTPTTTTPTTTTPTTTTPTTTTPTPTTSGTYTTSLTSSASKLSLVSGTCGLPLTLTTSGSTFSENVWMASTTAGLVTVPQILVTSGSSTFATSLCATTNLAAGTYNLKLWSNSTKYPAPANTVAIKVTTGTVQINAPADASVKYVAGFPASSSTMTFNLTQTPYQDLTVQPVFSDSNWISIPSQITFSALTKSASFYYMTTPSARGNFSTTVTFKLSGTQSSSFTMSGTQTIKGKQQ